MNESQIFTGALNVVTPADRAAYLDAACAGNPQLRAAVEALLQAHARAADFLERPAGSLGATLDSTTASVVYSSPGTAGLLIAGRYKLVEEIAEGGMGTVWMAQQQEPVRRLVAVKLIKPGMDSKQVLARFEAERQALALMDHPNIAKVHDAGAAPDGRPFFAMELVKGVPITNYCDDHRLTVRERLELFVPVCHAVQHAHQKGIIHRDLKPSNVLVGLYDDQPVPKVIDFGVAKATGQRLTEATLHTSFGAVVGTVEYMSPEQATFNQLDVDTRSDIYSLGVLLYELLTGTTPLYRKRLKETPLLELLRIVREDDTVRPSSRLSTVEELPSIAAKRGLESKKLSGVVRGELDWIVMKALEKDRNRRYETANGLAMDVQRYLGNESVLACPPSTGYRLRKFARRNRPQLALGAVLGLLVIGAGAFAWYSDRHAAQQQARHEQNAEAVAALLDQCEAALKADEVDRAALALGAAERRAADGGAEELSGRLARCRADVRLLRGLDDIDTFRWTWAGRGYPAHQVVSDRWRAALADYEVTPDESRAEEAAELINGSLVRDRVLGALDGWLSYERSRGVWAVLRAADPDAYRDAYRDILLGPDRKPLAALAAQPEALIQPARFAAVLGQHDTVPEDRRRVVLESALRARPWDLALLMNLGQSYPSEQPEWAGERVRWYQAAVAAHPRNLGALANLGVAMLDKGDEDGAIACFREAIRLDSNFAIAHDNLGIVLVRQGHPDRAVACFEAAIRADPNYASAHRSLGNIRRDKGDVDGAIAAYRDAIRAEPEIAVSYSNLGAILCDVKRDYDGAIVAFMEATRLDPKNAVAHSNLGLALTGKGDVDGAIAAYREAIRVDPGYAPAHYSLGLALTGKGDADGAIAAYHEAIRADPKDARAYSNLGAILCDVKRDYGGAITAFKEATRLDPKNTLAHSNLGLALLRKGDPDGAITAYREAVRLDSKDVTALDRLGQLRLAKGDVDGAIACFREAIRLDSECASAHYNLGNALYANRDPDQAIAAYREAVRLDPKNAPAHSNLGTILHGKGDVDGAIAAYRAAVRAEPLYVAAHSNLGLALARKGDMDGAIAAYREAIRLEPKHAPMHNELGLALAKKGDVDGAIAEYREAVRLEPKFAAAHNNLGLALHFKKDVDGAIACFREAIRLDSKLALAHFNLGNALAINGDPVGAIASLKESIRLEPKNAHTHNALGWMRATGPDRVRDGTLAVEHATRACELTGWTEPGFVANLAAAHAEAGDFDKAIELQSKALAVPAYKKRFGKAGQERLDLYRRKVPFRDPALAVRELAPPPREVKP